MSRVREEKEMRPWFQLYLVALSFVLGVMSNILAEDPTFATIDFPGATVTQATGINPRGDIVGDYTLAGTTHGYLLSGDGFTTIDFPSVNVTGHFGINPRGDIVGAYSATTGCPPAFDCHGYLLSEGEFTSIDFPGSTLTYAF